MMSADWTSMGSESSSTGQRGHSPEAEMDHLMTGLMNRFLVWTKAVNK